MNKYIKVDDLLDLISRQHEEIAEDYKEDRITFSSKIAMDGALDVLRQEIVK